MPDLVKAYNEKHPPIHTVKNLRTLCEILNSVSSSKTIFSQVCKVLKTVPSVPVTTATAERSFSALRRLKTFLRSSLLQTTLNYVMLLHAHKERTDDLDILHIAKQFISFNDRRRTVLFNIFVFVLCCTVKLFCFQGMFSAFTWYKRQVTNIQPKISCFVLIS